MKGRREQGRFAFEGTTLLDEAIRAGIDIVELYVTQRAYEESLVVRELDESGTPTFAVDDRTAEALSDLDSPTGVVAVAPIRRRTMREVLARAGLVLVLADLNDPGNAGTLLRSAEAFGASGALFGTAGVDPHHPKVVRAAMGSLFRLEFAVADPPALGEAAAELGVSVVGLAPGSRPLEAAGWRGRRALVVGNERHGLGGWAAVCESLVEVPMAGAVESLNAAVAGSIALYEAARNRG